MRWDSTKATRNSGHLWAACEHLATHDKLLVATKANLGQQLLDEPEVKSLMKLLDSQADVSQPCLADAIAETGRVRAGVARAVVS